MPSKRLVNELILNDFFSNFQPQPEHLLACTHLPHPRTAVPTIDCAGRHAEAVETCENVYGWHIPLFHPEREPSAVIQQCV